MRKFDIPGFEGSYTIDENGNVYSLKRTIIRKDGILSNKKKVKMVHATDGNGYKFLQLSLNGRCKRIKVHRLLGYLFIPNPENKPFINHKNGIKDDNRLSNLEWVTASENTIHAFKSGLHSHKGEKNTRAKITESDVLKIKSLLISGERGVDIAKQFGVTKTIVSSIKHKRSWNHV